MKNCPDCGSELTPMIFNWFCYHCAETSDPKKTWYSVIPTGSKVGQPISSRLHNASVHDSLDTAKRALEKAKGQGVSIARVNPIGKILPTPFKHVFICPDAIIVEIL